MTPKLTIFFCRGEYELHQAESSLAADAFDRADAFYRQALARDPNFVEAAAALVTQSVMATLVRLSFDRQRN